MQVRLHSRTATKAPGRLRWTDCRSCRPGDCPVTERISDQLVRLPLFSDLSEADQERVIEAVMSFRFPQPVLTIDSVSA